MTVETSGSMLAGRRQATIAVMIATAMQAFDATIANVALPQLERGFGVGIDLGSWVMTSYLCATAVTAILTGWLRRRWGARQVFTAAIGVFVIASLLCALATNFEALIIFRLIQGAAAGVIQPLSQAIILDIYPKPDHGRMLAIWGATIMAGPMLGPVLGGMITDRASWRWIFALNAPLGAMALLGLAAVPTGTETGPGDHIDRWGLAMLVVATGSFQLALQRSIGQVWPPLPETGGELAIAIFAAGMIAFQCRRARFGLLRLDVFRDINFAIAALYNFLVGAILFTTIVFIPALAQGPFAWTATQAGLAISPRGIGTMAMMLAIRYVIDRVTHLALLAAGLLITAGAIALMALAPSAGGGVWLAATSAAQGIGIGLLFTPLSTIAFSTLAADLRTDGAGVYNLARQLGCATGVAAMTALLQVRIQIRLRDLYSGGITLSSAAQMHWLASVAAYRDCFRLLAVIALAMIPGTLLFKIVRGSGRSGKANFDCGKGRPQGGPAGLNRDRTPRP
jgi:MFS transporter, DHA2 family, multidrug resistance protein